MMGDPKQRCAWVGDKPHFIKYHDEEWGVPVHDDIKHFEFLVLEGAQAGLSWETVLLKRENYRKVFAGFDPHKVAKFTDKKLEKILQDPGVIRNRLKIYSVVKNARAFIKVQEEFGSFDTYIWSFVGGKTKVNRCKGLRDIPAVSKESEALSRDMKKRGFSFVGSTVMYSHMQATGLVDDHTVDCFKRGKMEKGKRRALKPG